LTLIRENLSISWSERGFVARIKWSNQKAKALISFKPKILGLLCRPISLGILISLIWLKINNFSRLQATLLHLYSSGLDSDEIFGFSSVFNIDSNQEKKPLGILSRKIFYSEAAEIFSLLKTPLENKERAFRSFFIPLGLLTTSIKGAFLYWVAGQQKFLIEKESHWRRKGETIKLWEAGPVCISSPLSPVWGLYERSFSRNNLMLIENLKK